jgi:hypothetical protein
MHALMAGGSRRRCRQRQRRRQRQRQRQTQRRQQRGQRCGRRPAGGPAQGSGRRAAGLQRARRACGASHAAGQQPALAAAAGHTPPTHPRPRHHSTPSPAPAPAPAPADPAGPAGRHGQEGRACARLPRSHPGQGAADRQAGPHRRGARPPAWGAGLRAGRPASQPASVTGGRRLLPRSGPANAPGWPCAAQVKKASPSKGVIQPDFDAVRIAKAYEAGGAACLSVRARAPPYLPDQPPLRAAAGPLVRAGRSRAAGGQTCVRHGADRTIRRLPPACPLRAGAD